MFSSCVGNCGASIPPPDSILSMPPPPLPAFLLPKPAVLSPTGNDSYPCFATFMCEPNPHPRESGLEFVELTGGNPKGLENTWIFVLISSCVGVLILGGLLAVILLKCRETLFSSCHFAYHDSNIKQNTMTALGDSTKSNPFMAGGILYPCTSSNNRDTLQTQLANDSRLLWATLTPHGTRHFITDFPVTTGPDGHYEVVDYRSKPQNPSYREYVKRTPIKSFDNNGFIDYDYEDPTPLMDSYHDDLDSGYQEPQEILNTLQRASPRPVVSSPTRIDNPNMAPLNYYPSYRSNVNITANQQNQNSTLNRKATLNRRVSDASTAYGGSNMSNISKMFSSCVGNCGANIPPPDSILLMPPPPLPAFLLPKPAVLSPTGNDSYPCFATFMCEPNPHPRESGLEFVELTGGNPKGLENTWIFVLISSCVGVLILGGLLAVILLKCRETLFSSCHFAYHDSNIKQNTMTALGDSTRE